MDNNGAPDYLSVDDIGPVFEVVGSRLKSLEDDMAELKDVLMKIVTGFGEAVDTHKRDGYSAMLSDKYGADLADLGDPYKEIYGADLSEDLLSKLMGGEMDENGIGDHIGSIKAKFAKLRAPAADGSVEPKGEEVVVESEPEKEDPAEEAAESPEYQAGEEEALKDVAKGKGGFGGPGSDVLGDMMSTLKDGPNMLKGRARRR